MDVHAAALNGDIDSVRRYIAGEGDPNLLNEAGITPLHSAAVMGQAEVIRVLVEAGADTDLRVSRGEGGACHDGSPLLLAVIGGHLEATQALLEAGAEVGAKNSKGLSPLHVSCLKPNAAMVRLLLVWGADTNARDAKKRTAEQIIGRRCKDPAGEAAVRAVLQETAAAKQLAVANATSGAASLAHGASVPKGAATLLTRVEPNIAGEETAGLERTHRPISNANSYGETLADSPPTPPPASQSSRTTTGELEGQKAKKDTSTAAEAPSITSSLPPEPQPLPPTPPTPIIDDIGSLGEPGYSSLTAGKHGVMPTPSQMPPPPPPTEALAGSTMPDTAAGDAFRTEVPLRRSHGEADGNVITGTGGGAGTEVVRTVEVLERVGQPDSTAVVDGGVGGNTCFSCGLILEGGYELEKALPCSSGSSEVWFASKVFTGEEVVIKRVVDSKGDAFERERAVLKFLQRQGSRERCLHSIPFLGVIPLLRCLVLGRGTRNLRQIGQKYYQRHAGNAAGYMDRVRPYARQVVEICQWLHRLGIVWGDVKPENFVEGQDDDLKAIDFDSACTVAGGVASREPEVSERVGSRFEAGHVLTPRYCAPERARASGHGESCLATKASDIWSVGMVLYWLLTGQDYFEEGLTDAEVVGSLCSPEFAVSLTGVDPKQEQAKNLLGMMLSREPGRRGSMDSVLGRAFFAGGASVTAAKIQAEMTTALGDASTRLEATIREESGSTRLLLDESMKRLESRADEILGNLGRMDRMLDSLIAGDEDCPRLFILTPAAGTPTVWKPDTWFSSCNTLTFLCAHDLAPIGEGIKLPCPRHKLEKWAPAIQASVFVVKMGCKAACMTAGVSPAVVDGMAAALGVNFLAGQQVSAALRSAAGRALERDSARRVTGSHRAETTGEVSSVDARASMEEEDEGRKLTGEAYEALVAFLDESSPSWRAELKRGMTKAVRADGQVSWTCHDHAEAWSRSGSISVKDEAPCDVASATATSVGHPHAADKSVKTSESGASASSNPINAVGAGELGDKCTSKSVKKNGLGMIAKLRDRLGRHPAAANANTANQGKEENR